MAEPHHIRSSCSWVRFGSSFVRFPSLVRVTRGHVRLALAQVYMIRMLCLRASANTLHAAHLPGRTDQRRRRRCHIDVVVPSLQFVSARIHCSREPSRTPIVTASHSARNLINLNSSVLNRPMNDVESRIDYSMLSSLDNELPVFNP